MDSTNVRWNDLNDEQRREVIRRLEADLLPNTRSVSNIRTETADSADLLKNFMKLHEESYNSLQQQIMAMDERLSAVVRLMNSSDRCQTQPSIQILENQKEPSLLVIPQQEQWNEQILERLSRTFDLLEYTITSQQEQHQRENDGLHQIINRTSNTTASPTPSINFDMVVKVVQIVIVSLALVALFKKH